MPGRTGYHHIFLCHGRLFDGCFHHPRGAIAAKIIIGSLEDAASNWRLIILKSESVLGILRFEIGGPASLQSSLLRLQLYIICIRGCFDLSFLSYIEYVQRQIHLVNTYFILSRYYSGNYLFQN